MYHRPVAKTDAARVDAAQDALIRARETFDAGDEDLTLEALVEAWRAVRSAELADLVDALSERLSPHVPALDGKLETFQPMWLAVAKAQRAADLPRLLASVLATTNRFGTAVVAALVERGEMLARWPADPRSAAFVVEHLKKGGYEATSRSTLPFWSSLLAMLRAHDDPRTVQLLRPLRFARVFRNFSDGKRRIEWFQREVDALVSELTDRHGVGEPPLLPKELTTPVRRVRDALRRRRAPSSVLRERLARSVVPVSKSKPGRAARVARPEAGSVSAHLAVAVGAVDDTTRLGALLSAWRIAPAPELANLVIRVSRRLEARLPPIRGASRAAIQAEWLAVAARRDPADLPRLLESITWTKGRSTDALARIEALSSWPPDPRTAAGVAAQVEVPAFHAGSAAPFWTALFALAREHGDPRGAELLEGVSGRLSRILASRYGDRRSVIAWFRGQLAPVIDELRGRTPPLLGADDSRTCSLLATRLGEVEDALLAKIAARPQDDEAR
ncbi:MAG: hypothetical protein K0S65_3430, partial [Labilithrix sp.]|nr:hypothetical protein [Labilithrix sp.]